MRDLFSLPTGTQISSTGINQLGLNTNQNKYRATNPNFTNNCYMYAMHTQVAQAVNHTQNEHARKNYYNLYMLPIATCINMFYRFEKSKLIVPLTMQNVHRFLCLCCDRHL